MTSILDNTTGIKQFEVGAVLLYAVFSYLQQGSGITSVVQRLTWEPIEEHIKLSLNLSVFKHLHSLSAQDHLGFAANEAMDGIDYGVPAVQRISKTILFDALPTFADLVIAIIYFWVVWGWRYGLLVTVNTGVYLVVTLITARKRAIHDRRWYGIDDSSYGKAEESITNHETVKYFTGESFEVRRYGIGRKKMQEETYQLSILSEIIYMMESTVWTFNSLIGSLMCAYEISQGKREAGSFMTFIIFAQQLESPVSVDLMSFEASAQNT